MSTGMFGQCCCGTNESGFAEVFALHPWAGFWGLNTKVPSHRPVRWRNARVEVTQVWHKNETADPDNQVEWGVGSCVVEYRLNPQHGDFDFIKVTTAHNGEVFYYQSANPTDANPCPVDACSQKPWFWGPLYQGNPGQDQWNSRDMENLTGLNPIVLHDTTWRTGAVEHIDWDDPGSQLYSWLATEGWSQTCTACDANHFTIVWQALVPLEAFGFGVYTKTLDVRLDEPVSKEQAIADSLDTLNMIALMMGSQPIPAQWWYGGQPGWGSAPTFGPNGEVNSITIVRQRFQPRCDASAPCYGPIYVEGYHEKYSNDDGPCGNRRHRINPAYTFMTVLDNSEEVGTVYDAAYYTGTIDVDEFYPMLGDFPYMVFFSSLPWTTAINKAPYIVRQWLNLKKSIYAPPYDYNGVQWTTSESGAQLVTYDAEMNEVGFSCRACDLHGGEYGPWSGVSKWYPAGGDSATGASHVITIPAGVFGYLRRSMPITFSCDVVGGIIACP